MSNQKPKTLHRNLPLIEVSDPIILETLLNDPQTAPYILTRLSERVAVVAPGWADEFQDALKSAGHMPKVVKTK